MSKLGDDLIQSLNEAAAHAKDDRPGIEHARGRPRGLDAGESRIEVDNVSEEAD